jgi:hypothetical protein
MLQNSLDWASQTFETLFSNRLPGQKRWLTWVWLGILYLGGALLWDKFLFHGQFKFNFQDWYVISGPRFYFLKDALMHGALPLHIPNTLDLGGLTDRYMSIPDAFLAPQVVLLLFMSVANFIVANQILMYTLGFAGLLWFRQKYSLSPFGFAALVLLFNFNGHVLSHYGVGHLTWGGYFLFPWFAMLVICLLEGDHRWTWVAKMAALLLFMWLNGSFHQFVWCLLFLILLGLTSWKTAIPTAKAVGFSLILGLVRILPPAMLANTYNSAYQYLGGFPSAAGIIDGLTSIKPANTEIDIPLIGLKLGWWELSLYIGLIGAVFLAYFGIVRWLQKHENGSGYPELALPVLGMIVLSIGGTFTLLRGIPLFDGERTTARVISLPLVFVLVLAFIEFQRWLDARRLARWAYLGLVVLAGLEIHDLFLNFQIWQVGEVFHAFPLHEFNIHQFSVANHPDPAYFQALTWGAVGTAAGLLMLGLLVWLEKRGFLESYAQRALARLEQGRPSFGVQLRAALIRALAPAGKPARVVADAGEQPIRE